MDAHNESRQRVFDAASVKFTAAKHTHYSEDQIRCNEDIQI